MKSRNGGIPSTKVTISWYCTLLLVKDLHQVQETWKFFFLTQLGVFKPILTQKSQNWPISHFFLTQSCRSSSNFVLTLYNVIHSKDFYGNQGKHQNFDPSILPYEFGLIFMGMKQKKIFFFRKKNSKWPTQKKLIFQNRQFSKFFRENFSDSSLG